MDTEQIINYVTETPTNTNKAVLRGMLNSSGESGGKGYKYEMVTKPLIYTQTVYPVHDDYRQDCIVNLKHYGLTSFLDMDSITVTFNEQEYEVPNSGNSDFSSYGDYNFSQYPFRITSQFINGELNNILYVPDETPCTLGITAIVPRIISIDADFSSATKQVVIPLLPTQNVKIFEIQKAGDKWVGLPDGSVYSNYIVAGISVIIAYQSDYGLTRHYYYSHATDGGMGTTNTFFTNTEVTDSGVIIQTLKISGTGEVSVTKKTIPLSNE